MESNRYSDCESVRKKYKVLNYGCQMNVSDSEHYNGQLERLGYIQAEDFHEADVILINTCCVRESAEKKIIGKIGELKGLKAKKPSLLIGIVGCMAQKEGNILLKKFPQIDFVAGTGYVNSLEEIFSSFVEGERSYLSMLQSPHEFEGNVVRKSSFHAWIPIMYGCDNFCTYCIVPFVRGRERSRQFGFIEREIYQAVENGYKEFTLLGQNVNSYGKDWGNNNEFANLLRLCDGINGVQRLHYMTSHPRDMSEDVICAVADSKHISHHFHLPMQSGSTEILRRMNRGYTKEKYLDLVRLIQKYVPDAVITTDIIVGFPGETEEDFLSTIDVLKQVQIDAAYTFLYSKRSGTVAARMDNQVPLEVKKERLHRLVEVVNENSLNSNKKLLGKIVKVFVEGPTVNNIVWSGRTRENKLVLWENMSGNLNPGDEVPVYVELAQTWLVKGKIIE